MHDAADEQSEPDESCLAPRHRVFPPGRMEATEKKISNRDDSAHDPIGSGQRESAVECVPLMKRLCVKIRCPPASMTDE